MLIRHWVNGYHNYRTMFFVFCTLKRNKWLGLKAANGLEEGPAALSGDGSSGKRP